MKEPDLGPWREPLADDDDPGPDDGGDGPPGPAGTARDKRIPAIVDRWMRMPDHYDLHAYIAEQLESMRSRPIKESTR